MIELIVKFFSDHSDKKIKDVPNFVSTSGFYYQCKPDNAFHREPFWFGPFKTVQDCKDEFEKNFDVEEIK